MKKLFLGFLACFLFAGLSSAQTAFEKGNSVVNLGVSLGGNLYGGGWGSGYSRIPLIKGSYELCIVDNLFNDKSAIGVGALVGYTSAKQKNRWKSTDIMIGVQGAFHYSFLEKLDTYVGLRGTYDIVSWKWDDFDWGGGGSSSFYFNFYAGARYYFANSFGVFAEFSHGYEIATLGVALKF